MAKRLHESLTDQEPAGLLNLLTPYQDFFEIYVRPPTRRSLTYHRIHTGNPASVKGPRHPTSHAGERAIFKEVAGMFVCFKKLLSHVLVRGRLL